MSRSPVWVQQDYLFRNDDGTQAAATSIGTQNSPQDIARNVAFRLRINAGDTNNATTGNTTAFKLQFRVNAGAWTDVGAATSVQYSSSAYVSDANNDPNQRLNSLTGSTWTSGYQEFDTNNSLTSRTWVDTYTEYEFCLKVATSVATGATLEFRPVTAAGGVFTTYNNVPTLTVVAANQTASPDTGALTLDGKQPVVTLKENFSRVPDTGAVALAGVQPQVRQAQRRTPQTATLTLTGQTVDRDVTIRKTPNTAALTLQGYAPTIRRTYIARPQTGAITLTGYAPRRVEAKTVRPQTGSLTLAGQQGDRDVTIRKTPTTAALTLAGYAPTARQTQRRTPTAGILALTGIAPRRVVATRITPQTGSLALSGKQAGVTKLAAGFTRTPQTGALAIAGYAPTRRQAHVVRPQTGALAVTGRQPNVTVPKKIYPGTGALSLSGQYPSVAQSGLWAFDQALYPNGVTLVGLTGSHTDIDEDPSAPDGSWLMAAA